jgi:hypothetical protein
MKRSLVALVFPALLSGCTGLSFGENLPGSDVYLADGSIAVDDRTETSFVLQTAPQQAATASGAQPPPPESALFAVNPDTGGVQKVTSMTGRTDPRMLFPASGLLLMSELNGRDKLELFDKDTFAPLQSVELDIRYHGTRLSPSRNYIGVADNTTANYPIHIVDAATLERNIMPHNGEWLEGVWMNTSDRFVSIVFYDSKTQTPKARVLSWSIDKVAEGGYKTDEATGFWSSPELDIDLPGVTSDFLFSFTWVAVSPNDRYAVFPVRKAEPEGKYSYELIVIDTTNGEVRTVPDAKGPVGFTPDSSTIVSYKDIPAEKGTNQALLLINAETLEIDQEEVAIDGGITYFISHDGAYIVVASSLGGQELVLYDVEQDKSTQMTGPGIGLNEFVSRGEKGEMWIADSGSLYRLDLYKGELDEITTDFSPEHINILPKRDLLVLDDGLSNALRFFSPTTLDTVRQTTLPTPTP